MVEQTTERWIFPSSIPRVANQRPLFGEVSDDERFRSISRQLGQKRRNDRVSGVRNVVLTLRGRNLGLRARRFKAHY